jgi:hypothetical protein
VIPAKPKGSDGYEDCPQFHYNPNQFSRVFIFPDGLRLEIIRVMPHAA